MKTAAILVSALLALVTASAFAARPSTNPGNGHAPAPTPTAQENDSGDTGDANKPYSIPPAWGVTVCQDLKHTGGNAFGQCISATVRGIEHPNLPAATACSALRPKHAAKHSSRHSRRHQRTQRRAFRACTAAVARVRHARRAARSA